MGVTIHYRGRIKDLDLVETLEDRIVDVALELGGFARIWRSQSDKKPGRIVRGVMLDLAPGLEPVSLLIGPDGRLVPLHAIEDAEEGRLDEAPWVFVKTQFGAIEAHVALVGLLDALRKEFFPDLEVRDEGGYWETRDLAALREKRGVVTAALHGMERALRDHPLSPEAAEDPEIVARHVARLAEQIHRLVARPPEHPPVHFDDEEFEVDGRAFGSESQWDAAYKENIRKQERLSRAVEEREMRGERPGKALEDAMRDEGIVDLPGTEDAAGESDGQPPEPDLSAAAGNEGDEAWRKSLTEGADAGGRQPDDDPAERHPLLLRVRRLTLEALKLPDRKNTRPGGPLDALVKGVMEMSGGMAQVFYDVDDDGPYGLDLAQLKRALRGAAFARGAVFPARHARLLTERQFKRFAGEIDAIEEALQREVARVRRKLREGQSRDA